MNPSQEQAADGDAYPIFDSLDVDLVVKVLSHTAFSEPRIQLLRPMSSNFAMQARSSWS